MKWIHVATSTEGTPVKIFGVNIWDQKWINTEEKAIVQEPKYKMNYHFPIMEITVKNKKRQFAVGEISNGFYGFFIKEDDLLVPFFARQVMIWISVFIVFALSFIFLGRDVHSLLDIIINTTIALAVSGQIPIMAWILKP